MKTASAAFDIREQLRAAIDAKKCHPCGCFHDTVRALGETAIGRDELGADLDEARRVLTGRKYDCLGCQVCFPAIAANVFAQAFPDVADRFEACPTDIRAREYSRASAHTNIDRGISLNEKTRSLPLHPQLRSQSDG